MGSPSVSYAFGFRIAASSSREVQPSPLNFGAFAPPPEGGPPSRAKKKKKKKKTQKLLEGGAEFGRDGDGDLQRERERGRETTTRAERAPSPRDGIIRERMKRAVCIVALTPRRGGAGSSVPPSTPTRYDLLMVSRKKSTTSFSLPGGKVEADDASLESAACRELVEETGLVVREDELRRVFQLTAGGSESTCFLVTRTVERESAAADTVYEAGGGLVKWADSFRGVIDGSPFAAYNTELREVLRGMHILVETDDETAH